MIVSLATTILYNHTCMLMNALKFDSRFRIVSYKKDVLTKYSLSAKVRKWTILLVLKKLCKQRLSKFSSYLSNKTKQRLSKFRKL